MKYTVGVAVLWGILDEVVLVLSLALDVRTTRKMIVLRGEDSFYHINMR